MYKSYDDIPLLWKDVILTVSGEIKITDVPLSDINGYVAMMEGNEV